MAVETTPDQGDELLGGSDGFGDPDVVDIPDEDLEGQPPAEPEGEPEGKPTPPQQFTITHEGIEFPATIKDGKVVSPAYESYLKSQMVPRSTYQGDLDRMRSKYEGGARQQPPGREAGTKEADPLEAIDKKIAEVEDAENTIDPDVNREAYDKFERQRQREIRSLERERHQHLLDKTNETLEQRIAADEQREQNRRFEGAFETAAGKAGIPKGESKGAMAVRNIVKSLVAWDPRTEGFNDDLAKEQGLQPMPPEEVAAFWWNGLKSYIDEQVAAKTQGVVKAAENTTPSVHRSGAPAVAPYKPGAVKPAANARARTAQILGMAAAARRGTP